VTDAKPRPRALDRRRRENAPVAREKRHNVYVSPEEAGRLARLAEERHMTVPRLLVEAAFALEARQSGQTETERRELVTLLFNLHRALGAIGNNINQLARLANSTGEFGEELPETLKAVKRALTRVDAAMDEVSRP
jgi:hypothetical protein